MNSKACNRAHSSSAFWLQLTIILRTGLPSQPTERINETGKQTIDRIEIICLLILCLCFGFVSVSEVRKVEGKSYYCRRCEAKGEWEFMFKNLRAECFLQQNNKLKKKNKTLT